MRRLEYWILFALLLLARGTDCLAQPPPKIPRIGYISGSGDAANPGPYIKAFQRSLRDIGYIEGTNIHVEYRYPNGDAPKHVAELMQLKVDLIVATFHGAALAAKEASKTIPIVMVTALDPVATGIVESLARPGGNVTGFTRLTRELSGKRLELLKEIVPKMTRVGILWVSNARVGAPAVAFKEYETAAPVLKLKIQSLAVRGPNPDLERAFEAAVKERAGGLITIFNPLLDRHSQRITELAVKSRLAAMYERTEYVEAGGLVSYSAADEEIFKRVALYVDKILKGRKPADLPVEQPMKFEFVVNFKTAKQIGLTIPQWTLMKADRVIR